MKVETTGGIEFITMNTEQFETMKAAWTENYGTVEDVGDGVFLFEADGIVAFRARVGRTS